MAELLMLAMYVAGAGYTAAVFEDVLRGVWVPPLPQTQLHVALICVVAVVFWPATWVVWFLDDEPSS